MSTLEELQAALKQAKEQEALAKRAQQKRQKEEEQWGALRELEAQQELHFEGQDHTELARVALTVLEQAAPVVHSEGDLWQYRPTLGAWVAYPPEGPHSLASIICGFSGLLTSGEKPSKITIDHSDLTGTTKMVCTKRRNDSFFNSEKLSCSFPNGYLKIGSNDLELVANDQEHKCRFYHQFDYNSQDQCPKFQSFLNDLFRDDSDKADKVQLIRQYIGACLLGKATAHQRCLILYGESGDNGKSTLIRIIDKIFPEDFRCSLKPSEWGEKFSIALMKGKRMNYVSELPDSDTIRSDSFKQIISGDKIKVEEKGKPPYIIVPRCGHIFAANALPEVSEINQAFWKRFIVISFNRKFEKHEQNPNIDKEIFEEIPAIINWCISSYTDILNHHGYIPLASSDELLSEWKYDTNSVLRFVKDKCRIILGAPQIAWSKADVIYKEYNSYCEGSNYKPLSLRKFAKACRTEFKLTSEDCRLSGNSILPIVIKGNYQEEDMTFPTLPVNPASEASSSASTPAPIDDLLTDYGVKGLTLINQNLDKKEAAE